MKSKLRMLLGIIISGVCLYLVFSKVEEEVVLSKLYSARIDLLILAFFVTCLSYVLRAFRWKYLFKDKLVHFGDSYRALILGFFMNNVLPARIGEIVRSHALSKRINSSKSHVLATVAAERLADGMSISFMFFVLVYFLDSLQGVSRILSGVAMLFVCAGIGTFVVLVLRDHIFKFLHTVDKKIGKRIISYLLVRVERFIRGLEPLLDVYLLSRVIVFSVIIWGVELSVYGLIAKAFNEPMTIGQLGLFLAAVNFSSLVPAAPGGVGVIEAFASFALVQSGVSHEVALAMVVSQHLIQILSVGVPGLYVSFFERERLPQEVLST